MKHAGVLLVAILLIATSLVSSGTIKFGEDDLGQKWFGNIEGLITNSNGKAWSATGANLQTAIYDLNNQSGIVTVGSDLTLTSPIIGGKGLYLDLNGHTLTITTDIDGVHMNQGMHLFNGYISTEYATDYSSNAIVVDGANKIAHYRFKSWTYSTATIENIQLISNNYNGTGIQLICDANDEYISNIHVENVLIWEYKYGIFISCEGGIIGDASYINSNCFSNIDINGCDYHIWMNSTKAGINSVNGNTFDDLRLNAYTNTEEVIHLEDSVGSNYFTGHIYDWANAAGTYAFNISSDSNRNYFQINGVEGDILDNGNNNTFLFIGGSGAIGKLHIPTIELNPLTNPPTGTEGMMFYNATNNYPMYYNGSSWVSEPNYLIRNSNGKTWYPTDDNIQDAIWDLNDTDGGIVYLPEGTINVDIEIKIINHTELRGSGFETKLYWTGGVEPSKKMITTDETPYVTCVKIRDMMIYGDHKVGSLISGVFDESIISNIYFTGAYYYSVRLEEGSEEVVVTDNLVNNGQIGICVYKHGYAGVQITNNFIWGNVWRHDYPYGIWINDINGDRGEVLISGNHIAAGNGHGIFLQDAKRVFITGNIIKNNGQYASSVYSGIELDSCSNCTIISNDIREEEIWGGGINQRYGINISNIDCDNITCIDNDVRFNLVGGINDLGTNSYIIGNRGHDTIFPTSNSTTAQAGYAWFNTATNALHVYNGTAWVSTTLT